MGRLTREMEVARYPVIENSVPLEVMTEHGTIRWKEIDIPSGFHDKAFLRLEKN